MQTSTAVTFKVGPTSRVQSPTSCRGAKRHTLRTLDLGPRTSDRGFTLLELSLVLLILGVLFTLLVPRLRNVADVRLTSTAERLAATARYLFAEAAFTGQVYRLHYNLDKHTYWVTVLDLAQDSPEFIQDPAPLSRQVIFSSDVTFADVTLPSLGAIVAGEVFTHFYPQGYVDPTVIHLHNQRGRFSTVIIPPLTGEARVYDGYADTYE